MNIPQKLPYREGNNIVIFDIGVHARTPPSSLRFWGFFCLGLSLLGLIFLFSPILAAELNYRFYRWREENPLSSETAEAKAGRVSFGQLLWLEKKGVTAPMNWDFSLIIPKVGINAQVLANVNPQDEKEYKVALENGLAHAKGTSFPGNQGTVYIFGHSTAYSWDISRFNALFYSLKYLTENEEIIVLFRSKNFVYRVAEKKIVEANDLSYLTFEGKERLILQTCWPPGTTWKRLIIIAYPDKETET